MTSDRRQNASLGNAFQQQLTLSAYDKQFHKTRQYGQGNKAQMDMLKAVFRALNEPTTTEQSEATTSASTAVRPGSNGVSRLSGLNDFSLSLSQTEQMINPYRRKRSRASRIRPLRQRKIVAWSTGPAR